MKTRNNILNLLAILIRFNINDLISQIETLDLREQKVLNLRFGLEDGKHRTLGEVAALIPPKNPNIHNSQNSAGLTKERIRQIEAKAIRKLLHPSRMNKILPVLGDRHKNYINEINRLVLELQSLSNKKISVHTGSSIYDLDLPTRLENALLAKDIYYIPELLQCSYNELLTINNIGINSVKYLEIKLKEYLKNKEFKFNLI